MRILYVLSVVVLLKVLFPDQVAGQVKHVLYYDEELKVIQDPKAAKYVELIERESKEAENGTITFYKVMPDTAKYIIRSIGNYASVFHPRKAHGQLMSYHPNGKRESVQTYNNGVQYGYDLEWYDNDSIKHTISYKEGKLDGELKTFYKSGKLKREELYKEGEQVYGRCYSEDGNETAFFPYREMPQFPGGEQAMMAYLGKNIRYPINSQRANVSGLVVLNFVVNKSGGIERLQVLKGVSHDINREAMRVVKNMPAWQPGTFEGEKVNVRYTLPVRFTIR